MTDQRKNINNCLLCKTLGTFELTLSNDKESLKKRLENDNFQTHLIKETMAKCYGIEKSGKFKQNRPKKILIGNYQILGQNVENSSIFEMAEKLLDRDIPEIANFKDNINSSPIFIPENFIPKKPKLKKIEDISNQKKKIPGEIGDFIEKEVYETLKSYFKSRKEENVLMVQGML